MSLKANLPGARQPVIEAGGTASRPYYTFLQSIATAVDALSDASGNVTIPELPISENANVTGKFSIYTQGALKAGIVSVSLMGDVEVPGATQYYGSDADGERGWYAISSALAASDNVTVTTGDDGVSTFDLADLANSGVGAGLVKITRDSKGRISGTSAATTDDLEEGATNQWFTAARVRATVLTGLSLVSSAVITATDSLLVALGKLQAQITDNLLPKGYIDGLQMVWVSGTAVTVKSGAAHIPGSGKVVRNDSDMALTGIALGASPFGHLYVYASGGTLAAEVSTTVPAAPYNGTARCKTGDASRRYIGSVLADSSGLLFLFQQNGDEICYITNVVAPFRVLSGGTALGRAAGTVSLSGVIPVTANYISMNIINNGSTQLFVDVPEIGNSGSTTRYTALANQRVVTTAAVPSQTLQAFYGTAPSGSGAFIDVLSYRYSR
ncbi:hypothetical protein [Frateuria sp.]|uniref:hypothetical protein n=1 Tax=Frateuria sp. TaxID=2211372 RepID=UPI003F7DE72A